VLLAGLHRLEAIRHIKSANPTRYKELFGAGVPVRKFDFDAVADPGQALSVEVTENNQRRDYSPKEVRQLADRLIADGYVHRDGRPRKGEKPLQPALAIALGKSKRTIERLLAASQEPVKSSTSIEVSIWSKRRSTLRKWRDDAATLDDGPRLIEAIDRVMELLGNVEKPQG
jgi:ParB family chromosome partitioning protein